MEMKKYRLGEIGRILNGSTPSTLDAENYDGDIVWVTPKDLSDQKSKYFYKGERNITQKGYDSCSTQMIPANNILMSSRAPIGLLAINKVDCCTNQGFKNIILDKTISDVDYMYYYLKYHIKEVEALGSGTTFKEVSKISFEKYEISLPDLDIQQKIASVLSSLDSKIALNRRINAKLKQMAKRLYDYWFVQFDFPNAEGKPYKSSGGKMVWNEILKREIPEGWEVKNIGSVISKIASGKRPAGGIDKKLKEGIPSLGAECIDELGVFDYKKTPFIPFSFESSISSGIIEDGDILVYKDGAYVGKTTLFQDEFPFKVAYVNEHVFLIHTKRENLKEYLLFTLKNPTYFEIMQRLGKAKAAQPGLNQDDLCGIPIIIPSDEILNKYNASVKDLFHLLFKKSLETARLTALRDKLLPLLMNGQVTVK